MPAYTVQEYANMVLVYGQGQYDTYEARRIYQERFPDRRTPSANTFLSVVQRLLETGSFYTVHNEAAGVRTVRTVELEEEVLSLIDRNPSLSTRSIARIMNVSQGTICNLLKDENLYPYHVQKVHALRPTDFGRRTEFCAWFLQRCRNQPDFPRNILFTDESMFTKDGIWNQHNTHVWSEENPHVSRSGNFQDKFRINVWAGILNGKIIGPYILPDHLTSDNYLTFLQDLLDDLPLVHRQNLLWFQQDGAPPHYGVHVRNYLHDTFGEQWIGRGGPVPWPARSPDLTPLDFYLWGRLKSMVYQTPVDSQEEVIGRMLMAVEIISRTGQVDNIYQSMIRRCEECIAAGGRQFEQNLH